MRRYGLSTGKTVLSAGVCASLIGLALAAQAQQIGPRHGGFGGGAAGQYSGSATPSTPNADPSQDDDRYRSHRDTVSVQNQSAAPPVQAAPIRTYRSTTGPIQSGQSNLYPQRQGVSGNQMPPTVYMPTATHPSPGAFGQMPPTVNLPTASHPSPGAFGQMPPTVNLPTASHPSPGSFGQMPPTVSLPTAGTQNRVNSYPGHQWSGGGRQDNRGNNTYGSQPHGPYGTAGSGVSASGYGHNPGTEDRGSSTLHNRPVIQNHYDDGQGMRVTTPIGQRHIPRDHYHHDYIYTNPGVVVIQSAPVFYGGFYYGNYCDTGYGQYVYPSVYSLYPGFPGYIYNPTVEVMSQPYYPVYTTPSYIPFYAPVYQTTYNQNTYYVTNEKQQESIETGGDTARDAVKLAYPEGSYQAAFADIEKSWNDSNIELLKKHIRDSDTKISVLLKKKYAYSIASSDYAQITRDAMDKLTTVSFKFTRLRKAKNGDITAYGKHVYRPADSAMTGDDAGAGATVPFDSDTSNDNSQSAGEPEKTMYVSYTLRHQNDQWYIVVVVNSAEQDLVAQNNGSKDDARGQD